MADDDVLLPGDVAQLAKVTSRCVVQWEREKKLPAWKITPGGVRLFRRADVEAFLERRNAK